MKFSALFQQYHSMTEPSYILEVGGKTLPVGEDVRLLQAVCELTCQQDAGYLRVEAVMDPDGTNGSQWVTALQAGAKCVFSVGYGTSKTKVFQGFLYEVVWNDPLTQGALELEAVFLDVRGRLMLSSNADAGRTRTLSQMVQTILSQSFCTQLASTPTIGTFPEDWNFPSLRLGLSDYNVLCQIASFLCYEFYAWADTLYFGPPRSNSTAMLTFHGADGLIKLERRRTLAGQCAAVAVSGTDDQGGRIYARQARTKDSGFAAKQMAQVLSNDLYQPEPTVRTMAQAQTLSKARMQARQHQAGGISGRCLGTPELRPGRFLEFSGLSSAVNGSYYIHTIRHTLDVTGFTTDFEGED